MTKKKFIIVAVVIVGLLAGLVVAWTTGSGAIMLFAVGIAVGVLTAFIDLRRQAANWQRFMASMAVRFPTPDEA